MNNEVNRAYRAKKILFVVNSYFSQGNGLDESARRTVQALREAGEEVRVLSGKNFEDPDGPQPEYAMEKFHFPLMQPMLDSFGYAYADWHGPVIEEAVRWADVIHLEETFFLHHAVMNIAKKLGKPITGTYHVHPENIVYNCLGRPGGNLICQILYRYWCRVFYDHYEYLQCPTDNVRERLERHHVKAKCFTLSNGVIPDKCIRPLMPPADYLDENRPLDVIYIGRTAVEKDQPTLYKAIRLSKYAKRIRLHIAGRGPKLDEYTKMANQLYEDGVVSYRPTVGFYNRDELRVLASKADLAVHCAFVEVEGMSITEALQQAVVPVIATARYSGTATYALDERSIYPAGDAQALAEKIDYWLDHPQTRWEMGFRYAHSMKQYAIDKCAQALIRMFQKAIDAKIHEKTAHSYPVLTAAKRKTIRHYGRTA